MPIGIPVIIGTANNTNDNTSVVITVGVAGVPAGMTIIVDSVHEGIDDINHACSDNVNGAYEVDVVPVETTAVNARRFRFSNNAALSQGDTITVSWTGNSFADATKAFYIDGLDLTTPLTGTPIGDEGTSTIPNSGDVTTTIANSIILGFVGRRGLIAEVYTEDTDFTTLGSPVAADTGVASSSRALHTAHRIVSATETQNYAPTLGASRAWAAGISAYKAAAADHRRLIIGGVARGGTLTDTATTQDAAFESVITPAGTTGSQVNASASAGHRIISAIETLDYNPTLSVARPWIAGIAAYKADVDGGTSTPDPTITSPLTADTTEGAEFFYQIDASNGAFSYSASPLPSGLVVDTDLGHISGTLGAGTANTYNITLGATNDTGAGNATLVLTVNAAEPPPPGGDYKRKCLPTAIVATLGHLYHATSTKLGR